MADDSFDFIGVSLKKGRLAVVSQVKLKPFTFANIPASPSTNTITYITDSSTATIGAVVAGGGANAVLARYDGANWVVLGGGTATTGNGDLAALEALASTGILARTAADTYALRTITGTADKITLTDGNGVAGNPIITIAATYAGQTSIVTLGTVATGTWQATKIGLAYGGTNADLSATGGTSQVLKQTSAGANITVGQLNFQDIAGGGGFTVGTLPAAGTVGRRTYVTDANATTFASIVAGGGANVVPVFDNGTNWIIG